MIVMFYTTTYDITLSCFFINDTATTEIYTLSLHDALPILQQQDNHEYPFLYQRQKLKFLPLRRYNLTLNLNFNFRSEERFSRNAETDLVCRLLLEKKKKSKYNSWSVIV